MTQQHPSLPVGAASSPGDVARTGWAGITVAVAWTLRSLGVRVRRDVLRDARDHVLYHLAPHTSVAHAEDQAARLTARFVARARRQEPQDPWDQDGAMLLSPRWRRALDPSGNELADIVLRQHYGDGRSLDALEASLQVDRIALEAARGGLREVVRQAAAVDDVPVGEWPSERLDRLISRLAAFSPWACPPFERVLAGHERTHRATCARCDRAVRLLNKGCITHEDLAPPAHGARPNHRVRVLALHFHPDGRAHRAHLVREADVQVLPVGDDLLLLDLAEPESVASLLVLAAEVAAPARDHLRGAVVEAPGRWSRNRLLGPVVDLAHEAVRSRPWGLVEAVGELPAPLPEPPSARRWWMSVGLLGLAAAWSLGGVVHPTDPPVSHALEVQFTEGRGGIWTAFDVREDAVVTLVRQVDGTLDVVDAGAGPADKTRYAVGDGSYRLHTMGQGLLVVATRGPLEDLGAMVRAADRHDAPLDDLARRIRKAAPSADLRLHRP